MDKKVIIALVAIPPVFLLLSVFGWLNYAFILLAMGITILSIIVNR